MRTCALNRVDPHAWLTDVLTKLAGGWPNARIADLLPHHWAQQRTQEAQAPPT